MTKHGVDWSKYLKPAENLTDVSADALKRRRYLQLGGTGSSKEEKKALLKREANLKENASIGKELDPALDQLTDDLVKLADTCPTDRGVLLDFIWFGKSILRAFNYNKESVQLVEDIDELRRIWDAERDLPYSEQSHMGHFVDSQTSEFIGFARSLNLLPEFVKFEVDVLTAVLSWADSHPENFERRKQFEQELQARLEGRDTRLPIAAPVLVEPKEEKPIKTFQTAEDILVAPTPPTMQELAIKSFLENRSWVDGEEIT